MVKREIEDSTKEKTGEEANDDKSSVGLDLESYSGKKSISNWIRSGTTGVRDD